MSGKQRIKKRAEINSSPKEQKLQTSALDEAWSLYKQYQNEEYPDEGQTFMAEEALRYLIDYDFFDDDKDIHRYNLAYLYVEMGRLDLAVKLLQENYKQTRDRLSAELLAEIYLFGDAQVRDPEKALVLLKNIPESIKRNVLYFDALNASEQGIGLNQAIDLLESVYSNAHDNINYRPLECADFFYHAALLDWDGFHQLDQAQDHLDLALECLEKAPVREKNSKLKKHIAANILWLQEVLDEV